MKNITGKKDVAVNNMPADDDSFVRSLDELTAEDIPVGCERKGGKAKIKVGDIIQTAFIIACAAAFVICSIFIIRNLADKKRGNEIYGEASEIISPVTLGNSRSSEDMGEPAVMGLYDRVAAYVGGENMDMAEQAYNLDLASVKSSLSALKAKNNDVVGWIYVEDSRINYPLMRSSVGNDDYYLTHAYTGEYLAVGSVYMVSECDVKLDNNMNTLIYGHNVVNGSMFHDVTKFLDKEFFDSKLIYIYTLDGAYIYKPFSVYETTSDYNYIQIYFWDEDEFLSFASRVKGESEVPNSVSVASGDTIITLSTCTNGGVMGTGRYALHAKLVAFVD